jgi:transposase
VLCCPPGSHSIERGITLRLIGLDVHREFAQVVVLEHGAIHHLGRITTAPEALHAFARTLGPSDHVALEATCNTYAIARLLQQHAGRVVVSNPVRTHAIAEAKIKTDKVDAEALVRLLAADGSRRCGFLTTARRLSVSRWPTEPVWSSSRHA